MIEVNLSPVPQTQDFTKVGPINLSLINIPFLIVGIASIYSYEPIIDPFYNPEIEELKREFKSKKQKLSAKRQELASYADIKKQVKQLEVQEQNLASKIDIVKKIVEKRQNPFRVLKYIAEKTPKDVWISDLELDDKNLRMKGFSKSWASIGNFIEELKQSIHFDGAINYAKPPDLQPEYNGNRVETFEITTVVTNFKEE